MSDEQVLQMPIRRFWVMEGNINAISAERDMRMLTVINSAQSKEAAEETRDNLIKEMGQVCVVEDVLDRAGLESLRAMSG